MGNITVLGSGLVGSVIAKDLSKQHCVTAVDISEKNFKKLNKDINKIKADISDKNQLSKLISDADLVIGAVPGFMCYEIMKKVIELGKDIEDISFYPEDPFK